MKPRVAIIGPGRLGQTLAHLLVRAGYPLSALVSRDPQRAVDAASFAGSPAAASCELRAISTAQLVLLTIPDDQIAAGAAALQKQVRLRDDAVLIHCSGIHPAAILKEPGSERPMALALHPLQTFANRDAGVAALPGSPWSIEGVPVAVPLGEALIRDLGGTPFRLSAEQKPLYHAAASVTANFQAALFRAACEMLGGCGFSPEESRRLLTPLFATSAANIVTLGPEAALTGPVARGDVQTVASHLSAISSLSDDLQQLYVTLARQAVKTAIAKGSLQEPAAGNISGLLDNH